MRCHILDLWDSWMVINYIPVEQLSGNGEGMFGMDEGNKSTEEEKQKGNEIDYIYHTVPCISPAKTIILLQSHGRMGTVWLSKVY